MNRRSFLTVTVQAIGGLGFVLFLPHTVAQQSNAGQSLPLNVPTLPLDVVAGRITDQSIMLNLLAYGKGRR